MAGRKEGLSQRPALRPVLPRVSTPAGVDSTGWKRAVGRSLLYGFAAGLAVSAVMTVRDWHLNPAGIFHSGGGTDWAVVSETAASWLLPTSALAAVLAFGILYLRHDRRE